MVCCGVIVEIFEIVCIWDGFDILYVVVIDVVWIVIWKVCGIGVVIC